MNMALFDNFPSTRQADQALASKLAALAHPARVEILKRLAASNSCCCRDVVAHLDLAQSTVSQHLKMLVAAGLVQYAADGQRSRYSVDHEALEAVSRAVADLAASCRSCC